MKLADLIKAVKHKAKASSYSIEELDRDTTRHFTGQWAYRESDRLTCSWLRTRFCYDTQVGFAVHYLDGEPVFLTHQQWRHSDREIDFLSSDTEEKCRQFVRSLRIEPAERSAYEYTLNLDGEVASRYRILRGEEWMPSEHSRCIYRGRQCAIRPHPEGGHGEFLVDVGDAEVTVLISQVQFPLGGVFTEI